MTAGNDAADVRRARVIRLVAAVVILAIAAVVLIVLGSGGDDDGSKGGASKGEEATGVALSREMLDGVPQSGTRLGDPKAPVVITEFADLQCPFCGQYATTVLPHVIQEYVRPGKVQLELRLLRFIGTDSDRGARAAQYAAGEDAMWDFADLWYRNQGTENTGYADDEFIRSIGEGAGLDGDATVNAATDDQYEDALSKVDAEAQQAGIQSTPSFMIARDGKAPEALQLSGLTPEAFDAAVAPYIRKTP
jgi:protein-disulfide isomerase